MPLAQSDNLASQTSAFAQLLDDFGANNSAHQPAEGQLLEITNPPMVEVEPSAGPRPATEIAVAEAANAGKDQPPSGTLLPPTVNPPAEPLQSRSRSAVSEPPPQRSETSNEPRPDTARLTGATPYVEPQRADAPRANQPHADVPRAASSIVQQSQTPGIIMPEQNRSQVLPGQSPAPAQKAADLPSSAAVLETPTPATTKYRAVDLQEKFSATGLDRDLSSKPLAPTAPEPQLSKTASTQPQPALVLTKAPADTFNTPAHKPEGQGFPAAHQPQTASAKPIANPTASEAAPAEITGETKPTSKAQTDVTRAQLETPQPRLGPAFDEMQRNHAEVEPRRNLQNAAATPAVDPRVAAGVVRAVADMRQALNNAAVRQNRAVPVPTMEASAPAEAKLSPDWLERVVNAPSKPEHMHTGTARHAVSDLNMTSQTSAQRGQADAVYDQVMRAVTRQALQQGKLNLQLTPRELGSVDIEFSTERGELQVAIVAREQATRDLLDQALPRLRQSLQDAGINLGEVEVRQEQNRQQHAGAERRQPTQPENPAHPTDEQPQTAASPKTSEGGLNIYV